MKPLSPILLTFAAIMILPILLGFRGGWIEQDSYAFFGYFCQNGIIVDIPPISSFIFQQLPCDINAWFFFQAIVWILNLGIIFFAMWKFTRIPPLSIGVLGFCFSFVYSILSIEDDFLATGVIFYATLWLFHEKTPFKQSVYSALMAFLFLFVWKGSIIPMSTFLLSSFSPFLGLVPIIYYIVSNGLNNWGGATEAGLGTSFITLFPLIFILWFNNVGKFWGFYQKNRSFFVAGAALALLGAYQAKWGLYSAIFYPILFWNTMEEDVRKRFLLFGLLFILFIPGILVFTKPPQETHWKLIKTAVSYQESGKLVYTHWGVRWLFQYAGGKPNEPDWYGPVQNRIEPHFWLGPDKNCMVILQADDLFLESCNGALPEES